MEDDIRCENRFQVIGNSLLVCKENVEPGYIWEGLKNKKIPHFPALAYKHNKSMLDKTVFNLRLESLDSRVLSMHENGKFEIRGRRVLSALNDMLIRAQSSMRNFSISDFNSCDVPLPVSCYLDAYLFHKGRNMPIAVLFPRITNVSYLPPPSPEKLRRHQRS